jgi:hypothetical protein
MDEEPYPLSRIRIVVLLATAVAIAAFLAACGGSSDSGSSEDPQKVVDKATLKGVESGNLDLSLKVNATGSKGGNIDVSLSGPFQAGAKGELPEADFSAKVSGEAKGENLDFEGGATLLSDRAYIGYDGVEYEVDPTTFGFIKSNVEQGEHEAEGEGGGSEGKACQEAAGELEISDFLDNLKNEGGVEVEGTQTTEISGDLNVPGAIDQIIELTENPACSAQIEAAGPLPLGELERAKDTLAKQVKKAHASVFVGEDDDIVRKLSAELEVEPKGNEARKIDFELSLGEVNEPQKISPPPSAKPLEQLFQKLGINPLELLQGGASGGLGGLLEKLGIGGSGGESSGGGGGGGEGALGESKAYLECLQEAESATDLQECANLLPK